jgi:hypothetical protein
MTSSEARRPNYSRRFFWLSAAIVLLVAGYSAAWFYAAGRLETFAATAIASANGDGRVVDCAKPTARGFPFRIGLYCDSVRFEDQQQHVALDAAAFRSAAQVYNPFHIVAELDSPAAVTAPDIGDIGFSWNNLRASLVFSLDFPDRIAAEVDGLAVEGQAGGATASLLAAAHAEGHMRRNGPDIDLAGSFDGAAIDPQILKGMQLPPLAGEADLTIADGVDLVLHGNGSLRGRSGTIRTLGLSLDPATGLAVAGPFSVGNDGLLDADLKVTIRNPKGLAEALARIVPDKASQIQMAFTGLAAMGDSPSLPLRISKGKATLGFIPLGNVPPL